MYFPYSTENKINDLDFLQDSYDLDNFKIYIFKYFSYLKEIKCGNIYRFPYFFFLLSYFSYDQKYLNKICKELF